MDAHRQRLQQCALFHGNMVRQLEAEICCMFVVAGQISIVGRCGTENHIIAEIIFSLLAKITTKTRLAWLDCDTITRNQILYILSNLGNDASTFVSDNHGLLQNEVSNSTMRQIMDIRSTNANTVHGNQNLCGYQFAGLHCRLLIVFPNLPSSEISGIGRCS